MDLNGDGYLDILTGSWPGELFLFRGGEGHSFAAPEMLRDKEGQLINIGGGIEEDRNDGMILVRGTAETKDTPEGKVVSYRGKEVLVKPGKQLGYTGTASAAHAADWDGDGDYDLLVGDIRGNVFLVPNEGTPTEYAFGKEQQLEADGDPLNAAFQAGPWAADWDGDGDLDLLVGDGTGGVSLYRNRGTATAPELAAAEKLVRPNTAPNEQEASKEVRPGMRAKVCTADWNGDGRLDLLVGDYSEEKLDYPNLTPEERAEQTRIREEVKTLSMRSWELIEKLGGSERIAEGKEREALEKEFAEADKRLKELRPRFLPESATHGWVWLYLRK